MNRLTATLGRAGKAIKAFAMRWSTRAAWYTMNLGSTVINYAGLVGNGRGNAIVMAVVGWTCRTYPEAGLRVSRLVGDSYEPVLGHDLVRLLMRPNPFYASRLLWMATVADWMLTGNGYWLKIRSRAGLVVQLWWVPSTMIEPKWPPDGSAFLTHYEYNPNGVPIRVSPDDVVHFRYGLDPANMRKGLSPLAAIVREVYTDDEAANWTASLFRNMGVPGVILSPAGEAGNQGIDADAARQVKAQYSQDFGGDNRGSVMVMLGATKVDVVSFSPEQMLMKDLRRLPEERVTAIFGTPAVVVGLGAGLDRSTYANFAEAREAAYESNIIPTQALFAEELETQLLPDFEAVVIDQPEQWRIDHDLSQVRVLREDQDKLTQRVLAQLTSGAISLDEARMKLGDQELEGGKGAVYYVPSTVTVTPVADIGKPEPLALPAGETARQNGRAREGVAA